MLAPKRCKLPALSTWYLVLYLVLTTVAIGCSASSDEPTDVESSFDHQLRAVQAGTTDEVHVSAAPLSDNDLAAVAPATALRVLLIDHPESRVAAAGVRQLTQLPNLKHLRIRAAGPDDDTLTEIAKIKSLHILNLPRGDFTDAGLHPLKELPNLQQLRFGSPRVTDAGMKTLTELPALKQLHLIDVPITGAGLRELATIEQLESLYIDGGNLSDAALEELFRSRPKLHVHLNQEHHDRDPHKHQHAN